MSYTITLTNGNVFATVQDGTLNTDSSMTLVGRNYVGYGQIQDDNFIRLLESGANDSAPTTPLKGQLWYNTTANVLQIYNGTVFKSISGATTGPTAPSTSNITGDLWYDTLNQQLNVWGGTAWILVGPPRPTGTGAATTAITDGVGTKHSVIELTVDGNIVGIVSQDAFTPAPAVAGFDNVYPGINLSAIVNNQLPVFTGSLIGTATSATFANNAAELNGLVSNSFMRTDQNTSTTGQIQILNNNGLSVGNSNQFTANVGTSSTVNLYNNASNGNLHIGVNKGGTETGVILVDGSTGNVVMTGNLTVQGTTTTVNSNTLSTNDLVIYVANNASTSSQANGAGLEVGPISTPYARLTFNNIANIWAMSIPLSVNGGISSNTINAVGNVIGGNILTTGVLSVGGSATLTGVATAPTASNGTSNTQIATTEFVQNQLATIAPSPGTVVQTQFTQSTAGQTFTGPTAAVALSLTFTPRYANSKILVQMVCPALVNGEGALGGYMQIARGSTVISTTMMGVGGNGITNDNDSALPSASSMYSQAFDSAGAASPVTYNMLVGILQDEPLSPDTEYYNIYIGDAVYSQWGSVNIGYPTCNYSILIQEIKQ